MSAWTDEELESIGETQELQLASRRTDGTLRTFTTMWVVRVGSDVYVRSAGGPGRPWYPPRPGQQSRARPSGKCGR